MPVDPTEREVWEKALEGQECGNSIWLCWDHFAPNQYTIVNGMARLKAGETPTLFDVLLIEVNEDFDCEAPTNKIGENVGTAVEVEISVLRAQNTKLRNEMEQLKSQLESEKLMMHSHVDYLKKTKQAQSNEIRNLKKDVTKFKDALDRANKLIDAFGIKVIFLYL